MAGFRALLGEHVKAADADWQHWLPRLKKDPQVGAEASRMDESITSQ